MEKKSFISISIALVAIALGAASLFVSINSLEKQKSDQNSTADKADKAFAAAIESKRATEEIAALKAEIESLKLAIKQNSDSSNKNMKTAFEYYSKQVSQNRDLIIANQNAIKELSTRMTKAPVAPVVAKTEEVKKEETPAQAPKEKTTDEAKQEGEYIIYTIKSGDYFSKLAKQFKVSIEAIEAANPNVSSTALQIGQKINIPKAQ